MILSTVNINNSFGRFINDYDTNSFKHKVKCNKLKYNDNISDESKYDNISNESSHQINNKHPCYDYY